MLKRYKFILFNKYWDNGIVDLYTARLINTFYKKGPIQKTIWEFLIKSIFLRY